MRLKTVSPLIKLVSFSGLYINTVSPLIKLVAFSGLYSVIDQILLVGIS